MAKDNTSSYRAVFKQQLELALQLQQKVLTSTFGTYKIFGIFNVLVLVLVYLLGIVFYLLLKCQNPCEVNNVGKPWDKLSESLEKHCLGILQKSKKKSENSEKTNLVKLMKTLLVSPRFDISGCYFLSLSMLGSLQTHSCWVHLNYIHGSSHKELTQLQLPTTTTPRIRLCNLQYSPKKKTWQKKLQKNFGTFRERLIKTVTRPRTRLIVKI